MFKRLTRLIKPASTCDEKKEKQIYKKMYGDLQSTAYIIQCKCGGVKKTEEQWDADLGAYYCVYECPKCGYYWEGPIYIH